MMFRDKSISKFYAFALAAVFALTLAGCGGGGGSAAAPDPDPPVMMPDPDPGPTAEDIAQMIMDAQEAAATAAMLADAALNAAKEAVSGVSDIQDYDNLHYDLAGGALNDARRAKQAADDANTEAMAATTVKAAEAAQVAAEAAQADAEDALALTMTFVGAVKAVKMAADDAMADMQLTTDLMKAVADATTARDAAVVAAGQATMRLQELVDSDVGTNAEVHQATLDKAAADLEVMAANTALSDALDAQTARDLDAARTAVTAAQTAQANAEGKRDAIGGVKMGYDDEQQRMNDVATARSNANTSAMEADADAIKAEAAATQVERIAPDSAAATNARAAATAARDAATAAQAAHADITDDMSKEDADEQAGIAANQAMYANGSYMTASGIRDTTETSLGIVGEAQRKAAVADARNYGGDAVDVAKTASDDANKAASDARSAANRAKLARTDYANADTKATAAEAAASQAMAAYTAAKNAINGVMDDSTKDDADAARKTAEDEQKNAEKYEMAASEASDDAIKYANVHVIGLLQHANAQDLELGNPEDVDVAASVDKAKTERIKAVSTVINEAGAGANNINGAVGAANPTTVTSTWAANTPAMPDVDPPEEEVPMHLSIDVAPNGTDALQFTTEAADEDDTDTGNVDESIKTATKLDSGLGDFIHGYQIEGNDDNKTHVIVFTDKQQGTPAVTAVTPLTASEHTNLTVNLDDHTITDLGSKSGSTYSGVTFYETSTVDGETDEDSAFMGTLTCPGMTTCNIQTDADGDVTAITGYQFTGNRAARAAVALAEAADNEDYLAFGVWLQEDANGDTEGTPKAFAAFAGGGQAVDSSTYSAVLTGEFVYRGSAAGVYTEGESVDYFEGAATLTANFGAPGTDADDEAPDDEVGTIKGSISSIVAGGESMGSISLRETPITTDGDFSGSARMGTGVIQDDDTVKYPYNGSWSGNFYGPATDDMATEDVTEGPANTAPAAAAGTFGISGTDNMDTTTGDNATDDDVTRTFVGAFGARR